MNSSLDRQRVPASEATSLDSVVAVVLTHRRPRLAGRTVRTLIAEEGLRPDQIVLVIDRDGGLDDPVLEGMVRTVRLAENRGPAAGFRAGMEVACQLDAVRWLYLCEDDACLLGVPTPRLGHVLALVQAAAPPGAVVVSGRRYVGRGDRTLTFVPAAGGPPLQPVDVAAWGMTLLPRAVVDAGIRPDDRWFFGYEDFDFFLRMRAAGFPLWLDQAAALAVAAHEAAAGGGEGAFGADRPQTPDEPWRAYYVARNTFGMIRRHGRLPWYGWHLVFSVRRWQLGDRATRRAILCGWRDAIRGRQGRHPAFVRAVGEHPVAVDDVTPGCPAPDRTPPA